MKQPNSVRANALPICVHALARRPVHSLSMLSNYLYGWIISIHDDNNTLEVRKKSFSKHVVFRFVAKNGVRTKTR